MNAHEEEEIKKEFQLERVIFFSDAIFAIIITIMVLDVKLPEASSRDMDEKALLNLFLHIIPKLSAYIVSFFIIGRLWMKHLRIFSFLKDYNRQLIALNLLFLFSISLFPFALSFVFISNQFMRYPWGIYTYVGIIYFTYLTQTLLISYLIRNKHELCNRADQLDAAVQWRTRRIEFLATPCFIALMVCSSIFHFSAVIVYGLMVAYRIVIMILRRRFYPNYRKERLTVRSFFVKHKRVTDAERN